MIEIGSRSLIVVPSSKLDINPYLIDFLSARVNLVVQA